MTKYNYTIGKTKLKLKFLNLKKYVLAKFVINENNNICYL